MTTKKLSEILADSELTAAVGNEALHVYDPNEALDADKNKGMLIRVLAALLYESGGPTLLDVGSIPDASVLIRSDDDVIGLRDGWLPCPDTLTYASSTTATASGDLTAYYSVGMPFKLTQSATEKQFYLTAISYDGGSGLTTFTLYGGSDYTLADAVISDVYYSLWHNPVGFDGWFNFTPTASAVTGTITTYTASGAFSMVGNKVHIDAMVTITDAGTGSGALRITMPYSMDGPYAVGSGRENTSGKQLSASLLGATIFVRNYDNSTPIATSAAVYVAIDYYI